MVNFLSVDGQLHKLEYDPTEAGDTRSTGYAGLGIGRPIVMRFLNIFLKAGGGNHADGLLISTYMKAKEEKPAAGQAITYYNPDVNYSDNTCMLDSFGGANYGHELCYYSGSYLGESIRLSVRAIETHKRAADILQGLSSSLGTMAGLPMFAGHLVSLVTAQAGLKVAEGLIDLLGKSKVLLQHDLDLHYSRNNANRLQSGRILCIPTGAANEFDGFKLSTRNRLLDTQDAEYRSHSYFVIQINAESQPRYEKFDYYQGAAEILATIRQSTPTSAQTAVDVLVDSLEAADDHATLRQIERLLLRPTEEDEIRIRALYRRLSPLVAPLYRDRLQRFLGNEQATGGNS